MPVAMHNPTHNFRSCLKIFMAGMVKDEVMIQSVFKVSESDSVKLSADVFVM